MKSGENKYWNIARNILNNSCKIIKMLKIKNPHSCLWKGLHLLHSELQSSHSSTLAVCLSAANKTQWVIKNNKVNSEYVYLLWVQKVVATSLNSADVQFSMIYKG